MGNIFKISIKAIKFEDITVTFQPTNPKKPTIINTEKKQLKSGINTHKKFLNTNQSVAIIMPFRTKEFKGTNKEMPGHKVPNDLIKIE